MSLAIFSICCEDDYFFELLCTLYEEYPWYGVATIVQGAIVQGDSCPRRQLSKGQLSKEFLSKEIFVQVDSCPRRLLSKADFSPRRQLHVFLSKEELCFREGFKTSRGGCKILKSMPIQPAS